MRKQTLYLIGLVALLFGACKQEQIQSPVPDQDEYMTTTQLSDSTKLYTLIIDGQKNYVTEVNGVYYIADDIIINEEQFALMQKMSNPNTSTTERATIGTFLLTQPWPNKTVPYVLPQQSPLHSEAEHQIFINGILEAIEMFRTGTTVRFVERTTEREYLTFEYSSGNSSPLGWFFFRVNNIKIANYDIPGVIAHEILHSLGFVHEQMRPDRDNYIIVDLSKAIDGIASQFQTAFFYRGVGTFDFESIMLYSSFAGSRDPNVPVMTRLDGSTWGYNLEGLSQGDYLGINTLYP